MCPAMLFTNQQWVSIEQHPWARLLNNSADQIECHKCTRIVSDIFCSLQRMESKSTERESGSLFRIVKNKSGGQHQTGWSGCNWMGQARVSWDCWYLLCQSNVWWWVNTNILKPRPSWATLSVTMCFVGHLAHGEHWFKVTDCTTQWTFPMHLQKLIKV